MAFPPGAGGARGIPPLENQASAVLAAARGRFSGQRHYLPQQPMQLTAEQKAEALDTITNGGACRCCAGIHPGDEMACPRLASFELDGDGNVRAGSYFRDGDWDRSSVVFATDAAEEAGDGGN